MIEGKPEKPEQLSSLSECPNSHTSLSQSSNQRNESRFSSAAPAHTHLGWLSTGHPASHRNSSTHGMGLAASTGHSKAGQLLVCGAQTKSAHSAWVSQNSLPLYINSRGNHLTPGAAATGLDPSAWIYQEQCATSEALTYMQRQFQKQGNSRAKRIQAGYVLAFRRDRHVDESHFIESLL